MKSKRLKDHPYCEKYIDRTPTYSEDIVRWSKNAFEGSLVLCDIFASIIIISHLIIINTTSLFKN